MYSNISFRAKYQKIRLKLADEVIDKYIEELKKQFILCDKYLRENDLVNKPLVNNNTNNRLAITVNGPNLQGPDHQAELAAILNNPILVNKFNFSDLPLLSSFWCGYKLTSKQKERIIVAIIQNASDSLLQYEILWEELSHMIDLLGPEDKEYSHIKARILKVLMKEILKRKSLIETNLTAMESFTSFELFRDSCDQKTRNKFYSAFTFHNIDILFIYLERLDNFIVPVQYRDYNEISRIKHFIKSMRDDMPLAEWYFSGIDGLLPGYNKLITAEKNAELDRLFNESKKGESNE